VQQLVKQQTPYNLQFSTALKVQQEMQNSATHGRNKELQKIDSELAWMPGSHHEVSPVSVCPHQPIHALSLPKMNLQCDGEAVPYSS